MANKLVVKNGITTPTTGTPTSLSVPLYYKSRWGQEAASFDVYNDGKIRLAWRNAATDNLELEVLTDPSGENGEVVIQSVDEGEYTTYIKQNSDGLDPIGTANNESEIIITIWAPTDDTWPIYKWSVCTGYQGSGFPPGDGVSSLVEIFRPS